MCFTNEQANIALGTFAALGVTSGGQERDDVSVIVSCRTKAVEGRAGKGQLGGCNIISLDVREEHNDRVIDKIWQLLY